MPLGLKGSICLENRSVIREYEHLDGFILEPISVRFG